MEDGSNQRLSRILVVSLTVCGVILAAAAWWYYARQREALDSSVSSELTAVVEEKTKQIANWRSERIGDGGVLLSAPVAARARRILSDGAASASDRAELQDVLQRFITAFHYAGAALVARNGELRFEVNSGHQDTGRSRVFQAASSTGSVLLSDLYQQRGRPWMLLMIPVSNAGTMILDIDPSVFLYPYVSSWPNATRTAEALLARREGDGLIYLSEGRQSPGAPLWRRASVTIPRLETSRTGQLYKWTDYRGVPVMGVLQRIPESDWYLIAKVDLAEATASLKRLAWGTGLLIALIAATNAAGAALIWRNQQVRTYRDREAWFRQIANDTPAYLWMTSPGVPSFFINRRCARFLGTDRSQIDALWQYVHPDDQARTIAEYSACAESRSDYRAEFRMRRFDGVYRWMAVHGLPRYTSARKFAGYAGALTDVTERREAEEHLRGANQALASELRERTRSEREVHALSARLINAQEEERTRLARELHDDLSQQIAAASIGMSNLKRRLPADSGEALEHCNRIQQKLVNLASSMRRLSHELHPSVLQHSGLAAALRNYCSEFAELTSHRIAFHVEGSFECVPPAVALCVYRVAQEALQNSVKHARVEEAEVVLACSNGLLSLVVSDRGIGIGPDRAGGLGMVSMRERTRLVNGTIEVKSEPGAGVILTLKVPITGHAAVTLPPAESSNSQGA